MRLFVATDSFDEEGDFSFTVPGELVHFPPIVCVNPECGCHRAMAGFVSHKATTCFVTRDMDIDAGTYAGLLFDTLWEGGWVREGSADDRTWVVDWAVEHIDIAADLPVETPLRFDRDRVMLKRVYRAP